MEIDLKFVRERFSAMTREELLDEAALRANEYAPLVRDILQGEALARGIDPAQIEARRRTGAEASGSAQEQAIDVPALLLSADDKTHMLALAKSLRERGVPAVVGDLDPQSFHGCGHQVGRWGLMVPGTRAAEAARILETVIPAEPDPGAASCGGGCVSCDGESGAPEEQWPEDGDWWRTNPGEDDPAGGQRQVCDD